MKFYLIVILAMIVAVGFSDETPWVDLFDGKTLNGWRATSDANWRVEGGTIVVDSGKKGFLLHEDSYTNYHLHLEFNAAKGTNSGVFLNTTESPKQLTRDCYELNIAPADNPFPTGSLVARKKVEGFGDSEGWHQYEIKVEDGRVIVHFDGELILDYTAESPSVGDLIGLQLNRGWVAVRKLP